MSSLISNSLKLTFIVGGALGQTMVVTSSVIIILFNCYKAEFVLLIFKTSGNILLFKVQK